MKRDVILGTLCSIGQGLLFSVARPLLLKKIIETVSEDVDSPSTDAEVVIVLFACALLVEGVLQANAKQFFGVRVSCGLLSLMTSLTLEKSLCVHARARVTVPMVPRVATSFWGSRGRI